MIPANHMPIGSVFIWLGNAHEFRRPKKDGIADCKFVGCKSSVAFFKADLEIILAFHKCGDGIWRERTT